MSPSVPRDSLEPGSTRSATRGHQRREGTPSALKEGETTRLAPRARRDRESPPLAWASFLAGRSPEAQS
jgi:hypothetical protein